MNNTPQRHGIAAAGNWIVDRVKTVERLPGRGMLASILGEVASTGGAPANVLGDLARLSAPFPLWGFGAVGPDETGRFIRDRFRALGVNIDGLAILTDRPTSYTDVMSELGTGARTFFHHRGANAGFGPEHIPIPALTCRIFHFGYLLLLDRFDAPDPEAGTVAARLLRDVRAQGIRTCLDVVSEDGDRFRTLVPPALRHVDYLIINEIEAGRTVGRVIRRDDGSFDAAALVGAVDELLTLGTMELVAVHMPEGSYLKRRDGTSHAVGSVALPPGFIKGTVGAGDAFCAGVLYGLHEGWPDARALRLGSALAAASLSHEGATEGVGPLADVLALETRHGLRPPPIVLHSQNTPANENGR